MKLLLITDNFLPHHGGSRITYYEICNRLMWKGVCVVTKKIPGDREFDRQQKFRIYRLPLKDVPYKPKKLQDLPIYPVLFMGSLFATLKEDPDILYCGEILPSGLIGFIISRLLNIPYIIHTHGEEMGMLPHLKKEGWLARFCLRHANGVITRTDFSQQVLLSWGIPKEKIFKLYPGIGDIFLETPPANASELKKNLGLEDKRILLTVGRLICRKGHEQTLRALPEALETFPDIVYLIVGEGPQKAPLMALAEALGLAGKVKFLSVNMREELLRYYDACDVFLMPSRQLKDGEVEGFGIVYIEANARRKPVIAGNSGGTVEAVIDGETGLIVNGEDLHQIAQAIIRLLTDRELGRRMGEAGRRRAETEFRLQPEVDKISSYLKRVALGHKMKKVLGKRRFLFLKHDVDQNPVYYR